MVLINSQFLKLADDKVREKVDRKVRAFEAAHPDDKIIRLDREDALRPLLPCVAKAMVEGIAEMGGEQAFTGCDSVCGYDFLIDAIVKHEYREHKIKVDESEVFINGGIDETLAAIGDILCRDNRIAVTDPVFQTFVESNVIGCRVGDVNEHHRWSNIIYLECPKEGGFMPEYPEIRPDVIYLSYPYNPTGCVMTKSTLEGWVRYALDNQVLILFDATYESFITGADIPHSIYEIKGGRKVAIEFRSLSKNACFTGLDCGYVVIPKEIMGYSFNAGKKASLNALWRRRLEIKNHTPSYIIQRGAEALYTDEGRNGIKENIAYYKDNAALLRQALSQTDLEFWGGDNSPYIWVESPGGSSWELFDKLLNECHIRTTPGERFGAGGDGFVRISAFAEHKEITLATMRISDLDI